MVHRISLGPDDDGIYYTASGPAALHQGRLDRGQHLITGQPNLEIAANDQAHIRNLEHQMHHLEELPEEGTELLAGQAFTYQGHVLIVRQDHARTHHDPGDVPALFVFERAAGDMLEWIPQESVMGGDLRDYENTTYKCLQSHVTQLGWEPPHVQALWQVFEVVPGGEWRVGEAVEIGWHRSYLGFDYLCLQSHTTQLGWEPPQTPALWQLVGPV